MKYESKSVYRNFRVLFATVLIFCGSMILPAQTLVISTAPWYGIPLKNPEGIFGAQNAGVGAAVGLKDLFGQKWLGAEIGGGYGWSALSIEKTSLVSTEFQAGVVARYPFTGWLGLKAGLLGRYSWYILDQDGITTEGGSGGISGTMGAEFSITDRFSLGIGAVGLYDFGMLGFFRPYLSASYSIDLGSFGRATPGKTTIKETPAVLPLKTTAPAPVAEVKNMNAVEIQLDGVFPVWYKYYDEHPFGRVILRNTGKSSWTDVKMTVQVRDFMDAPWSLTPVASIAPGAETTIELTSLFNNGILTVTEATKVMCDLTLEYKLGGKTVKENFSSSLRVYDRNALSWSDDKSAAGFITAKDPAILSYAKSLAGAAGKAANPALNNRFQVAAAIHNSLCLYGVNYVSDPTGLFSGSKNRQDVDFLQFPRQTLEYLAGDCDDLSILYCAFFEAVGIQSALITIPGHIYMAVDLNLSPDEARLRFDRVDDFIFSDNHTWMPIEITLRKGGLLPAWTLGAKEWRENVSRGQAFLIPVHLAWETYEPVALPGTSNLAVPSPDMAVAAMVKEMDTFVSQEIADRVAKYQADIRQTKSSTKSVNALGLLYARYGMYGKAEEQFSTILAKEEYGPALVNMGHIQKLRQDLNMALLFYTRALAVMPENKLVLLASAKVNHDLENYGTVKKQYELLVTLDPDLADQYSYLKLRGEEGMRAGDSSGLRTNIEWMEAK